MKRSARGGYTLGERREKEKSEPLSERDAVETLREQDTDLVGRRIDEDLSERFMAYVKEHTDLGNNYGLALGYALREYRQQRRIERLIEKYGRVSEDVGRLMSEFNDDAPTQATPQEKRTVAMCAEIQDLPLDIGVDLIPENDIRTAIESVMGRVTDYLIETYKPLILDRLGYEPLPNNPNLYRPVEADEQEREREQEIEDHAAAEMDRLTDPQAIRTDGGITGGGE